MFGGRNLEEKWKWKTPMNENDIFLGNENKSMGMKNHKIIKKNYNIFFSLSSLLP